MSPQWIERTARRVLGWYPSRWRDRYAEEVLDVLDQHRVSARTVVNPAAAAAARLDAAYHQDRPAVVRRLRAGLALFATFAVLFAALAGVRLAIGEETAFGVTGAHSIAVSGDGRLVATNSGAATLRLWDITDPRHPAHLSTVDTGATFLALSPDVHTLAVLDDRISLWNITDPTRPIRVATLPLDTRHAATMTFSPDNRTLAVSYHGTVLIYDVTDPAQPRELTPPPQVPTNDTNHDVSQSQFSPDGRLLAIQSGDSAQVTLWTVADPAAPRFVATMVFGHDELPFGDLTFAPDSATLATGTARGHLTLWNVTDPAHPTTSSTMDDDPIGPNVTGVAGPEIALAFSPDGHTLTSVLGSVKAIRWDVTDRTQCHRLDEATRTDAGPGQFRLAPDARAVVGAAHGADTIAVWTIR
jgi:WD40 repeat protein